MCCLLVVILVAPCRTGLLLRLVIFVAPFRTGLLLLIYVFITVFLGSGASSSLYNNQLYSLLPPLKFHIF